MITIEESITKNLIFNEEYARTVFPHLEEDYFQGTYKTFFQLYKEQFDTYHSIPTIESLAVGINNLLLGEQEYSDLMYLIEKSIKNKNEPVDTQWLIKETESYCSDRASYNAVYKALEILEGTDTKLDKSAIPDILAEAVNISFDTTIGMEFFEDAEKRHALYTAEDSRIKFPLDALNLLSNGGLKKKTLSAILAGINVGKSALMCYLAGEFLKAGLNVLYISLEMAEEVVHQRIEANLLNITTDKLDKIDKDVFLKAIDKVKQKGAGKFFVKEYPTSSAHAGHFRHLLKELRQKKGFKPDVVFLDYINICASSRYRSMNGVNSYSYVKAIAEEVRGLAVEFDVPIMTATQISRAEFNNSNPDMTATSESFGLPASLDWFIAVTQDEVLVDNSQQMISLLKTRWGNKAKIRPQLVGINFDNMRYSDVGNGNSTREIQDAVGNNKPTSPRSKSESERKVAEIEWD